MTLEETFYLLGIVAIVAWLIFLIGLAAFSLILYRRFKETKVMLRNSAVAAMGMKLLKPASFTGFITLLPIAKMLWSKFSDKRRKA